MTELLEKAIQQAARLPEPAQEAIAARILEEITSIYPRGGATRSEMLRLLRGRGFSAADSRELKAAMDAVSDVIGYAGCD